MNKTKFGVNPVFYVILALGLAYFQNIPFLLALIVFLIAAEQNEWAARQTIQVASVSFIFSVLDSLLGRVEMFFVNRSYETSVELLSKVLSAFGKVFSVVAGLLSVFFIVILIIGVVKAVRGKELDFPLVKKFANWVYGKTAPKKKEEAQSVQDQQ